MIWMKHIINHLMKCLIFWSPAPSYHWWLILYNCVFSLLIIFHATIPNLFWITMSIRWVWDFFLKCSRYLQKMPLDVNRHTSASQTCKERELGISQFCRNSIFHFFFLATKNLPEKETKYIQTENFKVNRKDRSEKEKKYRVM